MKKAIISLFIIFVLNLIFISDVDAYTATITTSCSPTTVSKGSQITCTISGNVDVEIIGMELPFTLGEGLSAASFTPADDDYNYQSSAFKNSSMIQISTGKKITGSFQIGTMKINVADNASGSPKLTFTNSGVYLDNSTGKYNITEHSVTFNVNVPTGLTTLESPGHVLNFSPNTYKYLLLLESNETSFKLNATAANSSDTITIINSDTQDTYSVGTNIPFSLDSGKTSMQIIVKVGNINYEILISRKAAPVEEGRPILSSLVVGGSEYSLRNDTGSSEDVYAIVKNISNYEVKAIIADPSKFEFKATNGCNINGGTLTCNLNKATTLSITVQSKTSGGATKTYNVNIVESNTPSPGDSTNPDSSNNSENSNDSSGNTNHSVSNNPQTGTITFVIMFVLSISLIVSMFTYNKLKENNSN